MLTPSSFTSYTLTNHLYGETVCRIIAAAIQAVEPAAVVQRLVQRNGDSLNIDSLEYHLEKIRCLVILSLGKAAYAMVLPLVQILKDMSPTGLIIPKQMPHQPLGGFVIQPGGHPIPDEKSLAAGVKAMQLVEGLQNNDLLICLISGGGSALMSAPQKGLTLSDLQELTSLLLACGARIDEINTLRRHLDRLKGGGIARLAAPARVASLILSDVVDSPLEAIASGPTAPDPTTNADALSILEKYGLHNKVSGKIVSALESSPETPKPDEAIFDGVQNVIAGSNRLATEAALWQARHEGFHTHNLGNNWQGEARQVAKKLSQILLNASGKRPLCFVGGGETTVTLRGSGRGGRNQELALATVTELAGHEDLLLITLASDGEDGPTDAAGAVVGRGTLQRGLEMALSPQAYLNNNDSYTYFNKLQDLIKTGSTGTNVNDLFFMFAF
jgi:hydroxypyruvate reductase